MAKGSNCSAEPLASRSSRRQWHHVIYRYARTGLYDGGGAAIQGNLDGALMGTTNNFFKKAVFIQPINDIQVGYSSNFEVDDMQVYDIVMTDDLQCTSVIQGTWNGSSCILP